MTFQGSAFFLLSSQQHKSTGDIHRTSGITGLVLI